ncbi:MAG: hypothetical protein KDK39_01130 [Leptospiraceae bacterium]|nr:hypothetical protein [Leptospiraceae bacterium]
MGTRPGIRALSVARQARSVDAPITRLAQHPPLLAPDLHRSTGSGVDWAFLTSARPIKLKERKGARERAPRDIKIAPDCAALELACRPVQTGKADRAGSQLAGQCNDPEQYTG